MEGNGVGVSLFSSAGTLVLLLAVLAMFVEAVVQLLVASWLPLVLPGEDNVVQRALILRLCSSAFGVALAVLFGLDIIATVIGILGLAPVYPVAAGLFGQVLTGILFGRGAQWWHDIGVNLFGLDVLMEDVFVVGSVVYNENGDEVSAEVADAGSAGQ